MGRPRCRRGHPLTKHLVQLLDRLGTGPLVEVVTQRADVIDAGVRVCPFGYDQGPDGQLARLVDVALAQVGPGEAGQPPGLALDSGLDD